MPLEKADIDGRAFGADLVGGFDHHTGLYSSSERKFLIVFLFQGNLDLLASMQITMTRSENSVIWRSMRWAFDHW